MERRLDFRVAAGPGGDGVGAAQSGQSLAEGSEEGRCEVGLGAGGLEQDGSAGRECGQERLKDQAGGLGGQDDQAESVFLLAVRAGEFARRRFAEQAGADAPQAVVEAGRREAGGLQQVGIECSAFGAAGVEEGGEGVVPGGEQFDVRNGAQGRSRGGQASSGDYG